MQGTLRTTRQGPARLTRDEDSTLHLRICTDCLLLQIPALITPFTEDG